MLVAGTLLEVFRLRHRFQILITVVSTSIYTTETMQCVWHDMSIFAADLYGTTAICAIHRFSFYLSGQLPEDIYFRTTLFGSKI